MIADCSPETPATARGSRLAMRLVVKAAEIQEGVFG